MLLLAASVGLIASGRAQLASSSESATWMRIRPSIAIMASNGQPVGSAAFISKDGYLIMNSALIQRGPTEVITAVGQSYKFTVEAIDAASQLCLLKTVTPTAGVGTINLADAADGETGGILAVLNGSVVRAELGEGMKIGIDQKTRRTYPIQEVRVEQPTAQMGGALLFSKSGRLIGSVIAALSQGSNRSVQNGPVSTQNYGQQQILRQGGGGNSVARANLGPQGLIIGYTPTWEVTSKAIQGFMSPTKFAQYGVLGVFVKDDPAAGVDITAVTKGTGADMAGLKEGDVILSIDSLAIRNQVDFARAIYRLVPGSTVKVVIQRNGKAEEPISVNIGLQTSGPVGEHRQSSTVSTDSLDIR